MNIILKPFALLLVFFYNLFQNYGLALIFFALVVKIILFPFSLKGKKGMVKTTAIQGKVQRIQRMYANNKQKQQEEMAKLYEKEQVNPMGGCLWSFLPLLILIPLYAIIRQPLTHMMDMTVEQIVQIGNNILNWAQASIDHGWVRATTEAANNALTNATAGAGYNQLYMASLITKENLPAVQAVAPHAMAINFNFLGVDLSMVPTWKVWTWDHFSWNNLGLTLMPILSAALSLLMSVVTQKTNQMSNPAAENPAGNANFMLYVFSPLMSLWIGYVMPAGLCVYWIVNSVLSMVQEVISGRLLKKDYEAAAEAARKQELLDKEEEKRRRAALAEERAKRIAARKEEQKNKAKKKAKGAPAAPGADNSASAVGIRAYARGRAYDPNRFGAVTPYKDPDHPVDEEAIEAARAKRAQEREEAQLEADVTAQVAAEMAQLSAGTADDVAAAIESADGADAPAEARLEATDVSGETPADGEENTGEGGDADAPAETDGADAAEQDGGDGQ